MGDVGSPNSTLYQLASRVREDRPRLAARWLSRVEETVAVDRHTVFPSPEWLDHIPDLIAAVADYMEAGDVTVLEADALARATALGQLKHVQHASVHQLLREYRLLAESLEDFVESEATKLDAPDPAALIRAMRRMAEAVRLLQQHTVDSFVANYIRTLERQTAQLRQFSRLVSHEIRQPLAVLQVITRALPVPTSDTDSVRIMDIFDRSLGRLTEVTGKLERLARITGATDLTPSERAVDLTEVVHHAAAQLADFARERGVEVRVIGQLPVVQIDPARAELICVNLLANAIKFSDPRKAQRVVEISAGGGDEPSVIVRDNGIGMAPARLRTIFREFVRAHSQHDDDARAWGLGLGLSIVRECMDHANGSVRVDSFEGWGTTFKLTWPRPAPVTAAR